jgi:hypothetical protein
MVGLLLGGELERQWNDAVVANFRCYSETCAHGLRNTTILVNRVDVLVRIRITALLNRNPKRSALSQPVLLPEEMPLFLKWFFCLE